MLRAGTSVVTITPPLGTPLAGMFYYREAETIDDDLVARALVLDNGTARIALVVCDLISLAADTVAAARAKIEERCGIPAAQAMISCTHTHTGPITSHNRGIEPDSAYLEWLTGRIADSVAVACSRLVPAQVAYGAADVEGVCFNRRYRMRDGTVVFNPPLGSPDVVAPVGPVDPQVTAFLVETTNRLPLALWANLSTHYVGTDNERAISADYYGHFVQAVQQTLGAQCVGMLTIGTAGNVNNRDPNETVKLAMGTARARLVARVTAAAAVNATLMQPRHDAPPLTADRFPFSATRRQITPDDIALAEHILTLPADIEPQPTDEFSFVVGQPIPGSWVRTYAQETLALAKMPPERTTELQVMGIGEFALVALPGEIFVEFGLALKAQAPFDRVAVVTLANDNVGYVATTEAYSQGGYETWATRTSWTAPGTGEAMVEAVLTRLRSLQHQRSPPVAERSGAQGRLRQRVE